MELYKTIKSLILNNLNKLFKPQKLLSLVISEAGIKIYIQASNEPIIENIKCIKSLSKILELYQGYKVDIFLDLQRISYDKITLLDIGTFDIYKRLKEKIKTETKKHQIIHPILIKKPHDQNDFSWHFILIKTVLPKHILKALDLLLVEGYRIKNTYFMPIEQLNLCNQLKTLCFNKASYTDTFYIVHLQTQEHIWTVVFHDSETLDINCYKTSVDNAYYSLLFNIKRLEEKLILDYGANSQKIYNLIVCNEAITNLLRPKQDPKTLILSYSDVARKLNAPNYLGSINELVHYNTLFNTAKDYTPSKIKLEPIKTLTFFQRTLKYTYSALLTSIIILSAIILITEHSHITNRRSLNLLEKKQATLEIKYKEELVKKTTKLQTLTQNEIDLFHVIKNNKYPLEILSAARNALRYNINIKNLTYTRYNNIGKTTLGLSYPSNALMYRNSNVLLSFIDSLKRNLPQHIGLRLKKAQPSQRNTNSLSIPAHVELIENYTYDY